MGFVNDDGETAAGVPIADLVEDLRKLLDRGNDDLLPGLDESPQGCRPVRVPERRADIGDLPDRFVDLPVEDPPVGHHHDRVEDRPAGAAELDQRRTSQAMESDLPLPAECWMR